LVLLIFKVGQEIFTLEMEIVDRQPATIRDNLASAVEYDYSTNVYNYTVVPYRTVNVGTDYCDATQY
jgi:hypothetical protein